MSTDDLHGEDGSGLRIAIGAIFKNEAPYVLEWVAYHRSVGVDRFFIADNNSDDGTSEILAALAEAGSIDHIPFPHVPDQPPQLPAYTQIMRSHGRDADWIAFIDADEFLMPTDGANSIRPLIAEIDRDPTAGAIHVNWATYGSSGHVEAGDGLVIERFTQRAEKEWSENHHHKAILRSHAFRRTHGTPHMFMLLDGYKAVHTDGTLVRTHPTRGAGLSEDLVWDRLRLNHYVIKSRDEFFCRKQPKGLATVVNQKKGDGYFKHHDKNDVREPMPKYLIDSTLSEIKRLTDAIGKNAVRLRKPISSRENTEDTTPKIRGNVDFLSILDTNIRMIGWSVLSDGRPVQKYYIKAGDSLIPVEDVKRIERPDVVRHNPGVNILSGFQFLLPILGLPSEAALSNGTVSLLGRDESGPLFRIASLTERWPNTEIKNRHASIPFVPDEFAMPDDCKAVVLEAIRNSSCYLEYGTGGSTVQASLIGVPNIVAVESDPFWLAGVRRRIQETSGLEGRHLIYVDVGKTKQLGIPVSSEKHGNYHSYALKAWQYCKSNGLSPDTILIDGRFRAACCLATLLFSAPGSRILFDDYVSRENYHIVEQFVKPKRIVGRMAEFIVPEHTDRDRVWLAFVAAVSDVF